MADHTFTDPGDASEDWVDVRMTDPDEGEWDIDVIVAGGRVEYVDLRIRPELLAEFVECLIDDVGEERAKRIVRNVVERKDLDVPEDASE